MRYTSTGEHILLICRDHGKTLTWLCKNIKHAYMRKLQCDKPWLTCVVAIQLNQAYTGPEFELAQRYGEVLRTLWLMLLVVLAVLV
jgi:hypothetical protein